MGGKLRHHELNDNKARRTELQLSVARGQLEMLLYQTTHTCHLHISATTRQI